MAINAPISSASALNTKRFHIRGIPKKWIEEGAIEASWKLFEAVSDLVLVDNVAVHESKQHSDYYFGVLDVVRSLDAKKLTAALDARERLYVAGEKCHLIIRKFREHRQRTTTRLAYSREEMIQLQHKCMRPPRILASIYPLVKKNASKKKSTSSTEKN